MLCDPSGAHRLAARRKPERRETDGIHRWASKGIDALADGVLDSIWLVRRPARKGVLAGALGYMAFDIVALGACFEAFGYFPPVGVLVVALPDRPARAACFRCRAGSGESSSVWSAASPCFTSRCPRPRRRCSPTGCCQLWIPAVLGTLAFVQLRDLLRGQAAATPRRCASRSPSRSPSSGSRRRAISGAPSSGSLTATVASTLASGSPSDSTRQLVWITARPTRSTLGHASTQAPGLTLPEVGDVQVGGRDRRALGDVVPRGAADRDVRERREQPAVDPAGAVEVMGIDLQSEDGEVVPAGDVQRADSLRERAGGDGFEAGGDGHGSGSLRGFEAVVCGTATVKGQRRGSRAELPSICGHKRRREAGQRLGSRDPDEGHRREYGAARAHAQARRGGARVQHPQAGAARVRGARPARAVPLQDRRRDDPAGARRRRRRARTRSRRSPTCAASST